MAPWFIEAKSALGQLCELKPELIRDRQGSESAWSYHLRLDSRFRTVNFLSMVCDGCGSLTKEELLQQYFNGLRRKEEVRAKLDNIGLSLARPAIYLAGKAQAAVCLAALAGDIEEDSLEPSERNVYDELAELENMSPGSCQLFAAEMGEEGLFRVGGQEHAPEQEQ
ncbi:hypothetical protein CYMTET_27491 [Cymbomonas tetramitiformis]|uniref:Uncharacterized protein n=1 Tax=Cymbomonas tetramitiformis TaxID=36881 RepID=A0AAE0KWW7_9CHLO|nr:hypothetical protein CYMTET_27491 [Cymbomonas tetramitiformis]